jgi:hypothetical protein
MVFVLFLDVSELSPQFFGNLDGYTKIYCYDDIKAMEISTAVEKICGLN